MNRVRLWLLKLKAERLEAQALRGEQLLREDRAQLQLTYRQLRKVRIEIAHRTPARQLLADALRGRDAEIRRARQQPALALASQATPRLSFGGGKRDIS